MVNIDKLLSIASEALASEPTALPDFLARYSLGHDLYQMLRKKNGFYAFDSALHVFPLDERDSEAGLEGWNAGPLWKGDYGGLAKDLLFFAEDILQDQFCLSLRRQGILRFYAETGQTEPVANSIDEWAGAILSDHRRETGWPFVHEWQTANGPLAPGKRLMPKTPFFLGGEYKIENLWAGDAAEGMRLKADLAMQTRNLPEGAQVKLRVAPKPLQ
jgi:SMI1 / KNR4 family (SUKH-1)